MPLNKEQIHAVCSELDSGTFALRNVTLFLLGCYTGFRISELLSLRVRDIAGGFITVQKKNTKGKQESRRQPVHPAVAEHLQQLKADKDKNDFLFASRKGENKPFSVIQANRILQAAFQAAGLEGKYTTHTMRKTFALLVWEKSEGNILAVKECLGHSSITNTQYYLQTVVPDTVELVLSL